MKGTRKKYKAAFKAKVALAAIRVTRRWPSWRASSGFHPNQIYNWRKQLLDGAA